MATTLRPLALCAALLAGCTSLVDPKKIEPVLPASAADFCSQLRDALVARTADCFGALPEWTRQGADLPVCTDLSKAVTGGLVGYDKVAAADCLTALEQASCDAVVMLGHGVQPDFCARALTGTVALRGTCAIGAECVDGAFCAVNANTCPSGSCVALAPADAACASAACGPGLKCQDVGAVAPDLRCKPVSIAKQGDPCGPLAPCTAGTSCDTAANPNRCAPQRASGTCTLSDQCLPGYRCAGTAAAARTCQRAKALGAVCTPGAQECALGSSCDASGHCVLYPTGGGSCGLVAGELLLCSGADCAVPAGTTAGTCVAPFVCHVP
jgi:hypothetical protein